MCVEYFIMPYMVCLAASVGCSSASVVVKGSIKMRAVSIELRQDIEHFFSLQWLSFDRSKEGGCEKQHPEPVGNVS